MIWCTTYKSMIREYYMVIKIQFNILIYITWCNKIYFTKLLWEVLYLPLIFIFINFHRNRTSVEKMKRMLCCDHSNINLRKFHKIKMWNNPGIQFYSGHPRETHEILLLKFKTVLGHKISNPNSRLVSPAVFEQSEEL